MKKITFTAFVVSCLLSLAGCASMLGDFNEVLVGVNKGDANKVREAARAGDTYEDGTKEINGSNICGERPLHLAIQKGHLEITEILLQEGADPDLPSDVPREPSVCKSFGILKTTPGLPPMHYAITENKPAFAEALLFAGADPEAKTDRGKTALDLARGKTGFELLVAYVESPAHLAARIGDIGSLSAAVQRGDDLNLVMPHTGTTPLEEALAARKFYAVDFLFDNGGGIQDLISSTEAIAAVSEYLDENGGTAYANRLRDMAATR